MQTLTPAHLPSLHPELTVLRPAPVPSPVPRIAPARHVQGVVNRLARRALVAAGVGA